MAEKSSELENIKMIDTDSVEEAAAGDNASLQTRTDDYQSTDLETRSSSVDAASVDGEDVTPETEQLRDQIEETRRGMGETIDAIQEKLSFSNISEQVKDQVSGQISDAVETAKDAFYGKAGDIVNSVGRSFRQLGGTDLAKKAQENPTALAIIGAGIGALLVGVLFGGNGKKSKKKNASYRYENKNKNASYRYDFDSDDDEVRYADSSRRELKSDRSIESDRSTESYRPVESAPQPARKKTGDTTSSTLESVSGAASTAYAGVASAASSVSETVGGIASKTYEGAGSAASKTFETVGAASSFAYDKAGDLGGQMKINYDHYIEENPLAVGIVALALGAAVGLAIPLTRTENEYMGEYRDNVLEKAQTTAQDALGSVKQMATDAQKAITEEVKTKSA